MIYIMDINSLIREITYIIAHDDKLNSIYKNTWTTFRNQMSQLENGHKDIIAYNNKKLIINYFNKYYNSCKQMKKIIDNYSLTDPTLNDHAFTQINKIIDHYINIINYNIKNL